MTLHVRAHDTTAAVITISGEHLTQLVAAVARAMSPVGLAWPVTVGDLHAIVTDPGLRTDRAQAAVRAVIDRLSDGVPVTVQAADGRALARELGTLRRRLLGSLPDLGGELLDQYTDPDQHRRTDP